jgi:AraC family transcriptional regulator, regulatory protein of adaptative response / DNA-3-methyladenine glycosylase II
MRWTADECYESLKSRDRRFDGLFFVAVTSTSIYCRPVCRARLPKRENCRFFPSAAAAEAEGYRPCLKCRPELAPGLAPMDADARVVRALSLPLEAADASTGSALDAWASRCGVGDRQLRRLVKSHYGVAPKQLELTRRLLLAKQLLSQTRLPIASLARASGFGSTRRFLDAFRKRYRMTPTQVRAGGNAQNPSNSHPYSLQQSLEYRPPLDWEHLLAFFGNRALPGVEHVADGAYSRTVAIEHVKDEATPTRAEMSRGEFRGFRGWFRVSLDADRHRILLEVAGELAPVLSVVIARVRDMFDLDARTLTIAEHLSQDPYLAGIIARHPGLRVPGAFDGFEVALRAMLGQQVSVRAATTLSARLIRLIGRPLPTDITMPDSLKPHLTTLSPTPSEVASLSVDTIAGLGMPGGRAAAIRGLAQHVLDHPNTFLARSLDHMHELRGIGPWTTQYMAMRILRSTDAFPSGDLVIRNMMREALGELTPRQLEERSRRWSPWRSYATLYIWAMASHANAKAGPADSKTVSRKTRSSRKSPGDAARGVSGSASRESSKPKRTP